MRLSHAEWLALLMDSGRRHILEDLRRDGFHVSQIPAEVVGVVEAHIAVAKADDFASLRTVAKQPDDDLMHHIDAVSGMVGRSRRTVESRIRDRQVVTVKRDGRTYIRAEDIEKLKDPE